MRQSHAQLRSVYLSMIGEAVERLKACEIFLADYQQNQGLAFLDSAALQARKALEAIAFASIAPSHAEYEAFRVQANDQPDYTKDYHARRIFLALEKINQNFYPLPLIEPVCRPDNTLHFDRKDSGWLTKKRFESFYDRLGKHLHAHNPWSGSKNFQSLADDLAVVVAEAFSLLELHAAFIQSAEFTGAWIVEAKKSSPAPRIIEGEADGEFVV